ncbi:oxygen-dependent tRNA uridine(34) hydroxylase TrhO [Flaviflexus massiliensis]|uniref:oxygen-dependent tRNA uridine(34) hydroxylase TrhO n=1 Tax=Flaviflexus massiliensis TaxID=1522309 RepID=UPI0006D5AA19|nr:rhodanese-related sulfurtransferase [Flaviflexus massiliensis]
MMSRVLLFYCFTPLPDPEAIRLWQRDLCERLGLRGRILVSEHGINATVGGELKACKQYVKTLKSYPAFKNIDMKWSEGSGLDELGMSKDFPRLSVKARPEIVSFGVPEELEVDEKGVVGGGTHVRPSEVEDLIAKHPDLVFFDGRNKVEAEIGRFEGAIVPDTETTHDFVKLFDSGVFDYLKDTPILTYCTGGIRCEVLSALMVRRGFTKVYQLSGGIVRYGEEFGNEGRWQGTLTVFDDRETMDFGPNPAIIGICHSCASPASKLHNCGDSQCLQRLVTCDTCMTKPVYCTEHAAMVNT